MSVFSRDYSYPHSEMMYDYIYDYHTVTFIYPGSLFMVWGLWWVFITFWTYLRRKLPQGHGQHSSPPSDEVMSRRSWLTQPCCTKVPLEPIIKMLLPCLGVIAETFLNVVDGKVMGVQYSIHVENGEFIGLGRLFHITLYSAFVLSGIVDLLSIILKLPKHTSQFFMSFAFFSEAFLFYFHIHGRNTFNITIHLVLVFISIFCGISSSLRSLNAQNLLTNACFSGGLLMEGTWLVQTGSLLYGPHNWDVEDPSLVHLAAVLAIWHFIGISVFMMAVFMIMHLIVRRANRYNVQLNGSDVQSELEENEMLITTETETTKKGEMMKLHCHDKTNV